MTVPAKTTKPLRNNFCLFLDDFRQPNNALFWKLLPDGQPAVLFEPPLYSWQVVRSFEEFVAWIAEHGCPYVVSLDHDISPEHYVEGSSGQKPKYNTYKEKTGYDCLKWLIEYCVEHAIPLPICYVHSFNPEGRKNLFSLLVSYNKQFGGNAS